MLFYLGLNDLKNLSKMLITFVTIVLVWGTRTCELPDGRINSPVFLGRLPISTVLYFNVCVNVFTVQ